MQSFHPKSQFRQKFLWRYDLSPPSVIDHHLGFNRSHSEKTFFSMSDPKTAEVIAFERLPRRGTTRYGFYVADAAGLAHQSNTFGFMELVLDQCLATAPDIRFQHTLDDADPGTFRYFLVHSKRCRRAFLGPSSDDRWAAIDCRGPFRIVGQTKL